MDLATGWALFSGLIVLAGTVSTRSIVLRGGGGLPGGLTTDLRARCVLPGLVGAALTVLGLLLMGLRQFQEFRDPFAGPMEDLTLLMGTPWAAIWLRAMVGATALAGALLLSRKWPRAGWGVAAMLVAGLAFYPGLSGHAGGAERWRTLSLILDAVHVLAAGTWVGGLVVLLYLEASAHRDRQGEGQTEVGGVLAELVARFSPVAVGSVVILTVSGVWASLREVQAVPELWSTRYGLLLVAKLILVGAVLALGALNWRRLSLRLGTAAGDRALRRSARVELVVAQLVVLVTALLVRTSPGGG
jgi:copper transport protein